MSARISYMGTKHELAPAVRSVIDECKPGRLLDAFAGMGAVAEIMANSRPIWANDVQAFAHLASKCRFTDQATPPNDVIFRRKIAPLYEANFRRLKDKNPLSFRLGRKAVQATSFAEFAKAFETAREVRVRSSGAYSCFTDIYSFGYFSLEQCFEIDSIRCGLENLRGQGEITASEFDWSILALGRAMLRIANTTGHFAQFLTPTASNYIRVLKQFRKSAFEEWLSSLKAMKAVGSTEWRKKNLATQKDSISLLQNDLNESAKVVYCDPPYTDDQYSRYYHVWETLVYYDYPEITGKGRYRPNRFTTEFSLTSKVENAFRKLIKNVAESDCDLILSYPSNGLLHKVGIEPIEMINEFYSNGKIAIEIDHSHSTLGASKGPSKAEVIERIYVATAV